MKHVQIFIDESGSLEKAKPMNISGIVLVGSKGIKNLHSSFFSAMHEAGLSAGVCDLRVSDEAPPNTLSKRAKDAGGWEQHWGRVGQVAAHVDRISRAERVEIAAVSLSFPSNTRSPWRAKDPAVAKVIDRPYDARLQDLLELTLFDLPIVVKAMSDPSGCLISLNLPTRTSATNTNNIDHRKNVAENLKNNWGKKPWPGDGPDAELLCDVLEPSDGIEILTSVLNRRDTRLPGKVTFERCCCCKLVDWEKWSQKYNQNQKENFKRYQIAPKQVHYVADFLANAVFRDANQLLNSKVVCTWFERGFRLDTQIGGAEAWIEASRRFANRDRVGALRALMNDEEVFRDERTTRFFRQISHGWGGSLSSGDLIALFRENTPDWGVAEPSVKERIGMPPPLNSPTDEADAPSAAGSPVGTTLDLLSHPREEAASVVMPKVFWRVVIDLLGNWTPPKLLAELEADEGVPTPIALRFFTGEKGIECLLDLRSPEDVVDWISRPIKIGDFDIEARDATLPKQHRFGAVGNGDDSP